MFIDLLSAIKRNGSAKWVVTMSLLFCFGLVSAFSQNCDEEGGDLVFADDGSDTKILCTTDGIPDPLTVLVEGASGDNQIFLITDNYGNILANQTSPNFDFEGFEEGVCFIFNLAYEDGFTGDFGPGGNYCMFPNECYDLSDYLVVVKDCDFELCEEDGGDLTIAGTDETVIVICADDGESDAFDVDLENNESTNSAYLITDLEGNILSYPATPPFDLDGAGVGICLVWHISFEDDVTGLVEGGNAEDIDGCFDLSNFIQVTRYVAEAGEISLESGGTDTSICVDEFEDPLDVIGTDNTMGELFTFVITDDEGNILAIPDGNGPFDLNGAGPGTCLIWYLAYNPDIQGLEVGANAFDLTGCFDLSNAITVERNLPEAGEITFEGGSTDTTICAGDDIPDPLDVVQVGETSGGNFTFVITDAEGNILAIPDGNGPFDLDGAGGGTCLIWYLAFEDGLQGAEVGLNAGDLEGCFDLSNPLTVERNVTDGGTINFVDSTGAVIGDTITICAGDSIPDPLDVIQTGDPQGSNFTFVITDADANILAIPAGNGPFDLDDAGGGTCLIWYLAFEDGLQGAEVGLNAGDLEGCFDLSNPLTVVRLTGDECNECPFDDVPMISVDVEPGTDPCETLRDLTVSVSGPIDADSFMLVLTDSSGIIVNVANNTLGPVDFSVGRRRTGFNETEELPLDFFNINLDFFGYASPPHNVYLIGYGEDDYPFGVDGLLPRVGDEVDFTTIQDIDTGCISISEPIPFDVENCEAPCEADAGTLTPDTDDEVCLDGEFESAIISATTDIEPTVPDGFTVVYVLTVGDSLIILDINEEGPIFEVDEPGTYTIHTFVLDTFDIDFFAGGIIDGFLPTGVDVFLETIEGGGPFCASLLVEGATFEVVECDVPGLDPDLQTICLEDQLGGPAVVSLPDSADLVDEVYDLFAINAVTGEILQIETDNATLVYETFFAQIVQVYAVFYDPADFDGLMVGNNISDLSGSFVLSDPADIQVSNASNGCLDAYNYCDNFAPNISFVGEVDACFCVEDGADDFATIEFTDSTFIAGDEIIIALLSGDTVIAIADASGTFNFEGLPPGGYDIRAFAVSNGTIQVGDVIRELPYTICYAASNDIFDIEDVFLLSAEECADGVVFNEVTAGGVVEFFNTSVKTVNISQYRLSNASASVPLAELAVECGDLVLGPNEFVSVQTGWTVDATGELILYSSEGGIEFVDYVQWGEGNQIYTQMAIDAGLWSEDLDVQAPIEDRSLQYFPGADKEWDLSIPTICAPNESPSSVGQLNGPGNLMVFPNPASDQITIRTSDFNGRTGTLELSDLNGRTVLQRDLDQLNGQLELDLPYLARGTYMLRLSSEQAIRVIKLQIQ